MHAAWARLRRGCALDTKVACCARITLCVARAGGELALRAEITDSGAILARVSARQAWAACTRTRAAWYRVGLAGSTCHTRGIARRTCHFIVCASRAGLKHETARCAGIRAEAATWARGASTGLVLLRERPCRTWAAIGLTGDVVETAGPTRKAAIKAAGPDGMHARACWARNALTKPGSVAVVAKRTRIAFGG